MNMIMVQAIVGLVMVILFLITFKNDKSKIKTRDMTLVALLCVITAVLSKNLSIKFPPPAPLFVIGFSSTVAITIGILFSPKLALIAGLITDLIGLLFAAASGDASVPFLGFTLTAMLSCYLPSVLIRLTKNQKQSTLNIMIIIMLILSIVGASLYLFSTNEISVDRVKTIINDTTRYTIISILVVISIIIVLTNYFLDKKFGKNTNLYVTTAHLTLIVLVVEVVCHILLTSFWIHTMYQFPLIVAASTRIIKAILMLPINIVVIYLILKYIPGQYKKHLLKK